MALVCQYQQHEGRSLKKKLDLKKKQLSTLLRCPFSISPRPNSMRPSADLVIAPGTALLAFSLTKPVWPIRRADRVSFFSFVVGV